VKFLAGFSQLSLFGSRCLGAIFSSLESIECLVNLARKYPKSDFERLSLDYLQRRRGKRILSDRALACARLLNRWSCVC